MNNKHNIQDLDLLYADAKKLIDEVVLERIDGDILINIDEVINDMDEKWHGVDANLQINKLIDVKNMILDNRDIVGNIAVYLSQLVKGYRDAQNANANILPSFSVLNFTKIAKSLKVENNSTEIYMSDDIANECTVLNNLTTSIEEVNGLVNKISNAIFINWIQEEENRTYAIKMFEKFSKNSVDINKQINDIIRAINKSYDSYNFTVSKVDTTPSLEAMFTESSEEYTEEEKTVLSSIEKNFNDNKAITDNFNMTLVDEIKKDLRSKGIIE